MTEGVYKIFVISNILSLDTTWETKIGTGRAAQLLSVGGPADKTCTDKVEKLLSTLLISPYKSL